MTIKVQLTKILKPLAGQRGRGSLNDNRVIQLSLINTHRRSSIRQTLGRSSVDSNPFQKLHTLICSSLSNLSMRVFHPHFIDASTAVRLRRKWQPTPISLPGRIPWTGSLASYNLCDCRQSDRDSVTKQQLRLSKAQRSSPGSWACTSTCFMLREGCALQYWVLG